MSNQIEVFGGSSPIFGNWSGVSNFIEHILKSSKAPHWSAQEANPGRKPHPFNFEMILQLRHGNPYHSTCLETKKQAAVGLGFLTEVDRKRRDIRQSILDAGDYQPGGVQPPQEAKGVNKGSIDSDTSRASEILDELCAVSFQDVLSDAVDEFYQLGNGYIEVVRADIGGAILGLHHIPATCVYKVVLEDYTTYYEISTAAEPGTITLHGTHRAFAPFGKSKQVEAKVSQQGRELKLYRGPAGQISEIIHFRRPSSLSRWYGWPDWLSAVPGIEVSQKLRQYQHDFFDNRAVPEMLLFLTGAQVEEKTFKAMKDTLNKTIGRGNSHKSAVLNIDQDVNIQLERLAGDSSKDNAQFGLSNGLAMEIVTAHRVPPLLAGIQVPGKLGAANELVSTVKGFQALVIGPDQHVIENTLKNTLANPKVNGGLNINKEDFELCTITEELEVEYLDTVSRMRQDSNSPKNVGRDPGKGLKD